MNGFRFVTAARSHVGRVRAHNEDSYVVRPEVGLWAVADGMGGHVGGARASRLVTDRLGALPAAADAPTMLSSVERALADCHAELVRDAVGDEGPGTTVVVLVAFGAHFAVLWAGDSRAYRWREGTLQQLTVDHSLVADLVARGELAPEETRDFPWRNIVTRAVGAVDRLELDACQGAIAAGDIYLLCTDGLTGELEDAEIADRLAAPPEAAAEALLAAALDRGGRDNVSFVLVRVEGGDPDATLPGM